MCTARSSCVRDAEHEKPLRPVVWDAFAETAHSLFLSAFLPVSLSSGCTRIHVFGVWRRRIEIKDRTSLPRTRAVEHPGVYLVLSLWLRSNWHHERSWWTLSRRMKSNEQCVSREISRTIRHGSSFSWIVLRFFLSHLYFVHE